MLFRATFMKKDLTTYLDDWVCISHGKIKLLLLRQCYLRRRKAELIEMKVTREDNPQNFRTQSNFFFTCPAQISRSSKPTEVAESIALAVLFTPPPKCRRAFRCVRVKTRGSTMVLLFATLEQYDRLYPKSIANQHGQPCRVGRF